MKPKHARSEASGRRSKSTTGGKAKMATACARPRRPKAPQPDEGNQTDASRTGGPSGEGGPRQAGHTHGPQLYKARKESSEEGDGDAAQHEEHQEQPEHHVFVPSTIPCMSARSAITAAFQIGYRISF